ncbi:MAG TPA: MFS transporter [Bryobacteraceae bacterium]|nr:MFS transporter [Bryobacteraceae bacterium]
MNVERRWLAPYLATLFAMLTLQMSNLGFSPLLPAIRSAFHMSFAQMGLFAGMYGLLAILWSVPAGLLAVRFGEKAILATGLAIVAAGLAALTQAPNFTAAIAARALWLSGYRFTFVCVMVAVALTCPASIRGASMGILGAISALASVIGAPLGGMIGRAFGWRNGILVYAGVALAGVLIFVIFYRSDPEALAVHPGHRAGISLSAFRRPVVWALAVLSGLAGMGSLSANFFVPSAAQALFHLDQVGASLIISSGFTLAIVVNLLFGFLMDRFHRWKVMAVLAGLCMAGGIAMTSGDLMIFRAGAALVLALGHAGIQQSYTLAADVLRGRETGNVMGVVSMVAGVFSYLGPQMLGFLRDWSGGFAAGWYFIIGASAATLLLVLGLWSYASRPVNVRKRVVTAAGVMLCMALAAPFRLQAANPGTQDRWMEPGKGGALPAEFQFDDPLGRLGIVNASGQVDTRDQPFFTPLGANGRACVTCHQPAYAMSLSVAAIRERWKATHGKDPLFAAVDGSNCPDLPQEKESSHSLLLNRGLIRIAIPWPPPRRAPEFSIEVVSDPTGCNTSVTYGLHSARAAISVFRRPRMAANLKYVTNPHPQFALKLGGLADVDPETGQPVSMNFMADAREPSLRSQARTAARDHLERRGALSEAMLERIVDFESQIYVAQIWDRQAGRLDEAGGPQALGPRAMAGHRTGVLGDNDYDPVFQLFDVWKTPAQTAQAEFRASVARGNDIFLFRQFWLRDATHINSIGLGNPLKRTCATCHNAQMTGQDLSAGWVDVGTTNYPTWTEPPFYSDSRELPVFKIVCNQEAPPHPYLGRVIYTSDPGRALISGRCMDVGSIVMQQFRGLAARAPYFSNGSAQSLRELVDFYDRRFDMKLSEQEKQDLVNFLGVL